MIWDQSTPMDWMKGLFQNTWKVIDYVGMSNIKIQYGNEDKETHPSKSVYHNENPSSQKFIQKHNIIWRKTQR